MPRSSEDDTTARLVSEPVASAEPPPRAGAVPLRERIAAWRRENPPPPPTGQPADKPFFDALSGEV